MFAFSALLKIRRLWLFEIVIFPHSCLIHTVPFGKDELSVSAGGSIGERYTISKQ